MKKNSRNIFFAITGVILLMLSTSSMANTAIEFYNTNLDHFFITADPNEAAQIDKGSAGPGWVRTGKTFFSGGNTPVCRFYGSQNPGPNSHFYTVDAGECNYWKQQQALTPSTQKRWNFESLDFLTTAPTNGNCPINTTPVYRAYNNGWTRGIDSNHRFSISFAAIQEVLNRGWTYEGVVMCAPASDWWPPATITPMGVKVVGANPLSETSMLIGDTAWKQAVQDGTIKPVDTGAIMTGFSTRPIVWMYFTRNNNQLYCVTPVYKDDGSAIGNWTSPGSACNTSVIDWVIGTNEGIIQHYPGLNQCIHGKWDTGLTTFTGTFITCPQ